jgi:hypothetical protein
VPTTTWPGPGGPWHRPADPRAGCPFRSPPPPRSPDPRSLASRLPGV